MDAECLERGHSRRTVQTPPRRRRPQAHEAGAGAGASGPAPRGRLRPRASKGAWSLQASGGGSAGPRGRGGALAPAAGAGPMAPDVGRLARACGGVFCGCVAVGLAGLFLFLLTERLGVPLGIATFGATAVAAYFFVEYDDLSQEELDAEDKQVLREMSSARASWLALAAQQS